MSLRAIPLLVIPFVLYNAIAMTGFGIDASLVGEGIPMMSGGKLKFTWGDVIILITLIVLFIEIVKSTYTSAASLLDHGLSMLVFIAALVEFLLVPQAATAMFFLLIVAMVIDVIAGFTIGIRVARRDLNIGAEN